MNAVQEWALRRTVLVELVHPMVIHCAIRILISRFDYKSRFNHRDGDEFMVRNLDAGKAAIRDGSRTRPTDTDYRKKTSGGILNGLLHILAEVTHLGRFGVRVDRWSHIRCGMS